MIQQLSITYFIITGLISPSHTFPHQRAHTLNNRRSAPSNSELLQMKLRRLINDSALPKDNTFDFYSMTNSSKTNYCRRPSFDLEDTKFEPPKQFSTPKCLNQEVCSRFFFFFISIQLFYLNKR